MSLRARGNVRAITGERVESGNSREKKRGKGDDETERKFAVTGYR